MLRGEEYLQTGCITGYRLCFRDNETNIYNPIFSAHLDCNDSSSILLCYRDGGIAKLNTKTGERKAYSVLLDSEQAIVRNGKASQSRTIPHHWDKLALIPGLPGEFLFLLGVSNTVFYTALPGSVAHIAASSKDDRTDSVYGTPVINILSHSVRVTALCVSSDGSLLASGDESGKVKVTLLQIHKQSLQYRSTSFTMGGHNITSYGDELHNTVEAHTGSILCAHWLSGDRGSSDDMEHYLITGSNDRVARVWSVRVFSFAAPFSSPSAYLAKSSLQMTMELIVELPTTTTYILSMGSVKIGGRGTCITPQSQTSHEGPVTTTTCGGDDLLALGTSDGLLYCWRLPQLITVAAYRSNDGDGMGEGEGSEKPSLLALVPCCRSPLVHTTVAWTTSTDRDTDTDRDQLLLAVTVVSCSFDVRSGQQKEKVGIGEYKLPSPQLQLQLQPQLVVCCHEGIIERHDVSTLLQPVTESSSESLPMIVDRKNNNDNDYNNSNDNDYNMKRFSQLVLPMNSNNKQPPEQVHHHIHTSPSLSLSQLPSQQHQQQRGGVQKSSEIPLSNNNIRNNNISNNNINRNINKGNNNISNSNRIMIMSKLPSQSPSPSRSSYNHNHNHTPVPVSGSGPTIVVDDDNEDDDNELEGEGEVPRQGLPPMPTPYRVDKEHRESLQLPLQLYPDGFFPPSSDLADPGLQSTKSLLHRVRELQTVHMEDEFSVSSDNVSETSSDRRFATHMTQRVLAAEMAGAVRFSSLPPVDRNGTGNMTGGGSGGGDVHRHRRRQVDEEWLQQREQGRPTPEDLRLLRPTDPVVTLHFHSPHCRDGKTNGTAPKSGLQATLDTDTLLPSFVHTVDMDDVFTPLGSLAEYTVMDSDSRRWNEMRARDLRRFLD
eukprot:gene4682-9278_t